MDVPQRLYRTMYLIRKTEEEIERLFTLGLLRGTSHGYRGQEAVAAAVLSQIDITVDYATGTHRSHGHFLALTGDPHSLIAEMMGRPDGAVGGIGGSQHLRYKNFYSNGITGGMVPVAVGLAMAQKIRTDSGIVACFFGEGAMNEGYALEAFNLAAVKQLPVLFVLENNGYAMSTPISQAALLPLVLRPQAFGIESFVFEATDVTQLYGDVQGIITAMRADRKPRFVEMKTFRFSGHSKNDKREYVDRKLEEFWQTHDPMAAAERHIGTEGASAIRRDVDQMVAHAVSELTERGSA